MIIYLIENTINNKKYVGQTLHSLEKRWQEHVYTAHGNHSRKGRAPLYSAIRKYGPEAFTISILDTASSQEELNQKEIEYIKQFRTTEKAFGYNLHTGGNHPPPPGPHCWDAAAIANTGRKHTEETKRRMSEAQKGNQFFLGHQHSEETKQKMSEIQKERCRKFGGSRLGLKSSPEHVEKIRKALTGKHPSKESRLKMSLSKMNPSDETRQRMRLAHLGKPWTEKQRNGRLFRTIAWG